MPEGPQVRRVGTMIAGYAGRDLLRIEHPRSRPPWALELPVRITEVRTHGKNTFIHLSDEQVIYNHMLMWGSWRTTATTDGRKRLNTAFYFGDGTALGYYGGGILKLIDQAEEERILAKLGPDVLDTPPAQIAARLGGSAKPAGEALLDQSLVAGVGNIYKSEALFAARIHPLQALNTLDTLRLARLSEWLCRQMSLDVKRGGIITTPANLARQGIRRFVYRRSGRPCLFCETVIERIEQGGRSTYFCPRCQPASY